MQVRTVCTPVTAVDPASAADVVVQVSEVSDSWIQTKHPVRWVGPSSLHMGSGVPSDLEDAPTSVQRLQGVCKDGRAWLSFPSTHHAAESQVVGGF